MFFISDFKKYFDMVQEQKKYYGVFKCWFEETLEKYVLNQKVNGIKCFCYYEPYFENAVYDLYEEIHKHNNNVSISSCRWCVDKMFKGIASESVCKFFAEIFYKSMVNFFNDLIDEYGELEEEKIKGVPSRHLTEKELLFFGL